MCKYCEPQLICAIVLGTALFCVSIVIPFIVSVLQIAYMNSGECVGMASDGIVLLSFTIVLLLIILCFFATVIWEQQEFAIIGLFCGGGVFLIQYGFICKLFVMWNDSEIVCSLNHEMQHVILDLYLTLIILYSILFGVAVIVVLVTLFCVLIEEVIKHFGEKYIALFICLFVNILICIVLPILQVILITSNECNGHITSAISVTETVFLIITLFLFFCSLCYMLCAKKISNIIIVVFLLFVVQYGLITHSVSVWLMGDTKCSAEMEQTEYAAITLFLIWWTQCTAILVFVWMPICCICLGCTSGPSQESRNNDSSAPLVKKLKLVVNIIDTATRNYGAVQQ